MGEMVTKVPPTVEALKKKQNKQGGGSALSEWIAQQILFM